MYDHDQGELADLGWDEFIRRQWDALYTAYRTGPPTHITLNSKTSWSGPRATPDRAVSTARKVHELIAKFNIIGPTDQRYFLGLGQRPLPHQRPGLSERQWTAPGAAGDLELHPTVKPTALIADLIRDCSRRNGLILDLFGGSGTTHLAAERTGRVARVIELDPVYVDVAIRRWERATGARLQPRQDRPELRRRRGRAPAPLLSSFDRSRSRPHPGRAPVSTYKVGYGKPPKARQIQAGANREIQRAARKAA